MASGCPSHTPSATMRRWLPTSLMRTAAGMGRPGGGELDPERRDAGRGPVEVETGEEGERAMVQRWMDATDGTEFI